MVVWGGVAVGQGPACLKPKVRKTGTDDKFSHQEGAWVLRVLALGFRDLIYEL